MRKDQLEQGNILWQQMANLEREVKDLREAIERMNAGYNARLVMKVSTSEETDALCMQEVSHTLIGSMTHAVIIRHILDLALAAKEEALAKTRDLFANL